MLFTVSIQIFAAAILADAVGPPDPIYPYHTPASSSSFDVNDMDISTLIQDGFSIDINAGQGIHSFFGPNDSAADKFMSKFTLQHDVSGGLHSIKFMDGSFTTKCLTNTRRKASLLDWYSAVLDFCTYCTSGPLQLVTGQTYGSGSQYCDGNGCRYVAITYNCRNADGTSKTVAIDDFNNCLGFSMAGENNICGVQPYGGAMVTSSDGCWTFLTIDLAPLGLQ